MLLLLALACKPDPQTSLDPIDVDVEQNEIVPTVFQVSWSAEDVDSAWIEWGLDEGYGHTVAIDVSGAPPYATPVYGMKAGTEHHLRVVAETPDGQRTSEDVAVTTGSRPTDIPTVSVEDLDPSRSTDGYLITGFVQPPHVVIFDHDGDLVWWYSLESNWGMLARVWPNPDGESFTMGDINIETSRQGLASTVRMDGTGYADEVVNFRHHDLLVHDDGTLVTTSFAPVEVEGTLVAGDKLVEIGPDGALREVFDSMEWFDFHDHQDEIGNGLTWPHANAVEYLPAEDAYLVSFLAAGSIVKIDRQSGQPLWFLGGFESDFVNERGDADIFDVQHQMQVQDDGSLLVFENGEAGTPSSRAVQLELDMESGVAREVWSYEPSPSLLSPVLGDVHRFDSGNTLVTFSYNGEIHEVDESGELLWKLSAGLGGALGYVTWVPELQPSAD